MRIVLALLLLISPAFAQHNHERHHDDYREWQSRRTANCCSEQDCGMIPDADVREGASGTEIKIDGEWCPVRREHYITRGKSPDWNTAHACILRPYLTTAPTCDRLLCFTGKGGF